SPSHWPVISPRYGAQHFRNVCCLGRLIRDVEMTFLFPSACQPATFVFGGTTENAVIEPVVQCVVQTFFLHWAPCADGLGACSLLRSRSHFRDWKEQFRIFVPAGGTVPPVFVSVHDVPPP